MRPEIAISHYKLGKLSTYSIVDLADLWLEEGNYTDSLNYIVMEQNPSMAYVGPLFERAIKELGLAVPDKVEAAKIAANGPKDKLTGKFHGDIIPTVPNGSYFTYDFAPSNPNGKFDERFSTLVHFLIFLIALLISGMMLYASVIIDVFFDLFP